MFVLCECKCTPRAALVDVSQVLGRARAWEEAESGLLFVVALAVAVQIVVLVLKMDAMHRQSRLLCGRLVVERKWKEVPKSVRWKEHLT